MTASSVSVPLFSISMAFLHAARPLALERTTGLLLCALDDCTKAATLESADPAIQRRLVIVLIGPDLLYTPIIRSTHDRRAGRASDSVRLTLPRRLRLDSLHRRP